MALKVLLADDSVPAQNMGKKILTDAGYEVLAVSNGLEALKKIADNVPDIAILDIFMPGYTGLEVCSRLRGNTVTAELPVILTVGKLEPYRPEDGEKVHSNAVIVKPFASNELVSAVRSLVGLPFAIRPEAPEVKAPASSAPASTPVPEDDYEEEAPMLHGSGFGGFDPDAKRTAFSASAVEEAPATPARRMPAFEATAVSSAVGDFEIEPATALAGNTAATATALVEWWQPTPEPVEQIEASESEVAGNIEISMAAAASAAPEHTVVEETLHKDQTDDEHTLSRALATLPEPPSPTAAGAMDDPAEPVVALPQHANCGRAGDPAAAIEAFVPDRESRMQAFEALFNADEALPVEANPAALPDLLAQEELDASEEHETESAPLLEDSSNEGLPIAAAASEAMEDSEIAGSHELHFDSESLSTLLTTGTIPHEPQPAGTATLENSFAEPEPACNSFYASIPEDAELANCSKPIDAVLEAPQAAMVEAISPMTCHLPQEEAAEGFHDSLLCASPEPEPETTEFASVETVIPQSNNEQSEFAQLEAPEPSMSAEPADSPAEGLASRVLQQMASELVPMEAESEQACDEHSEEGTAIAAATYSAGEANRVHKAVESVFDRFRPLLIAAIARELTKRD